MTEITNDELTYDVEERAFHFSTAVCLFIKEDIHRNPEKSK